MVVGALVHNGEVSVPVGDSVIHPGDLAVIFTIPESVRQVEKMFGG